MSTLTIGWIALPLFLGFSSYLLPRCDRILAFTVALVSLTYGLTHLIDPTPLTLNLLDSFGVTLIVDELSGFFIVTNALVTAAVVLYCWPSNKSAFFFTQTIILHGCVNAVFICADLMSIYVALEVIGLAAFLLITYPRNDRTLWVGFRYLFVSNTAMLFYLLGAVLVYQANQSFALAGLANAPRDAVALIFIGLLTKGGIFISGLWLPLTHSESETPVSALLSGAVVKTGVFPLARCALMVEEVAPIIQIFSVGTALLGVTYAILEKDTKRTLAASTISQLGFVLVAPAAAGFYALTHGLAKAALFLTAGNLPSRKFAELRRAPLFLPLWIALAIAGLSISGFPLLAGFGAKTLTLKSLDSWQAIVMNIAAVGTAIAFAKFLFLPRQFKSDGNEKMPVGLSPALTVLLGGLIVANGLNLTVYTLPNLLKAFLTIGIGWLAYGVVVRHIDLNLPKRVERFEHLIGGMSLMLMLLFVLVAA
ncbi:MAG: cation:proton antiporter [Cyanobacteria bacterium J06638_28]